jgi:2,4-dienoyl-CoA reductase-like NADH-dependent reductase (Old Yellow Enzyme family)
MPQLFETTVLNGMVLRNRFVHSATNEGMAEPESGYANERLIRWQEAVAAGEVGMLIPGYAYVSNEGKSRPGQTGIHSGETVPGLTRMAEAAHRHGARIVLQIAHAGCNMYVPSSTGYALGPSDMKVTEYPCRAMTKDDMAQTVADFAAAALKARAAGFDGVQLHGAHSYLLSQFLSPHFNRRTDEYGGSLENRARFPLEVVRAVRAAVGQDYPVLIKTNSDDYLDNGFVLDEFVPYCLMLEEAGVDAIEVSGGTHFSDPKYFCSRPVGTVPKEQEIYFKEAAERYRRQVKTPLILVGGVRTLRVAEQVVSSGLADYVALSRPLIREPNLVKRWHEGDTRPSTCISCNLCFGPVRSGEGVYCVAEARQRQKRS